MTPLEIQQALAGLIAENQRGANALFESEKALAEAEYELDQIEQKAFIRAEGTVKDREAIARLESADKRLQRDLRRAEHQRIKVKIKAIETGIMALATQAKLVQSEIRI